MKCMLSMSVFSHNTHFQIGEDSLKGDAKHGVLLVIIPIYLAVFSEVRNVNSISFPSNYPGKARAVFKLYFGVRCQLKIKRTTGAVVDSYDCGSTAAG